MNNDTVGLTSTLSATARTHESQRSDRLFNDILAPIYANRNTSGSGRNDYERSHNLRRNLSRRRVVNAVMGSKRLRNSLSGRFLDIGIKHFSQDIAVRVRFLDDIIEQNFQNVRQIVLLACGGDFRPYRLPFLNSVSSPQDLTFYLLDVPHVLKYRQQCFRQLTEYPSSPCKVVEVPCDLSNPEWSRLLHQAGFAIDQPTLWLAEGFFHYLNEQQLASLFNQIQQLTSSDGSSIAFDLVSRHSQMIARRMVSNGLIHFALDDENEVFRIFSEFNCYDIECTSFRELGRKYRRYIARARSFIVQAKIYPAETS